MLLLGSGSKGGKEGLHDGRVLHNRDDLQPAARPGLPGGRGARALRQDRLREDRHDGRVPVRPFAGEPEAVADAVVRAMDRGRHHVYAPGVWRWIMLVIRALPRVVLRRVRF